jgi:L-threonylcarbamoyladenylate synthase
MATVVSARGDPPPPDAIEAARRALAAGRVVALPTDTIYGLAADAFHTGAADRLFTIKQRPRELELPVLVADVDQARSLSAGFTAGAEILVREFWPGPLTLVLPRRPELDADLGSDEATIGIRCPDHPVPRSLCRVAGPLATTSANLHGSPPLTTAEEVADVLGHSVAVVLDGGRCEGAPSTVVDCTGTDAKCLREGRVSWARIAAALESGGGGGERP